MSTFDKAAPSAAAADVSAAETSVGGAANAPSGSAPSPSSALSPSAPSGRSASAEGAAATELKMAAAGEGSIEGSILVAVRARPLSEKEIAQGNDIPRLRVVDDKMVVVLDDLAKKAEILRSQRESKEKRYVFDHAFGPDATTEQVYGATTKFLISGVMQGYNATVFAYGATGTGKTHTMIGHEHDPGIMVLAMRDFFAAVLANAQESTTNCKLSYLEVYNEQIHDLLAGGSSEPSASKLDLREDPVKGASVAGISEVEASCAEEVMELLERGNRHRVTESTAMNVTSSRSHAVLQIMVETRERTGSTQHAVRLGKLSLIDLAGSERAQQTRNVGTRLTEGANINRSLLALGNCINALAGNSRSAFVPYRDSKLTRLLKDSLGGNSRTVMIVNVSPAAEYAEESLNTLKYANRAKNIKTKLSRNVLNVNYHVAQYKEIIAGLREEIGALKERLVVAEGGEPNPNRSGRSPDAVSPVRDAESVARNSREKSEMEQIRREVMAIFEEKQTTRRGLDELHVANLSSSISISKRQLELRRWEEGHPKDATAPSWVSNARVEVKNDQVNMGRNNVAKKNLENQLQKAGAKGDKVQQRIAKCTLGPERKSLLQHEYIRIPV